MMEEIDELKAHFDFIPSWRLDDIMISYAPEGSSVGPHFDQYDVFLLQAKGQREWKIGQFCDDTTELVNNNQIQIIKDFQQQNYLSMRTGRHFICSSRRISLGNIAIRRLYDY